MSLPIPSAYRAEKSSAVPNEVVVNTLEQVAIPTLSKSALTEDLAYPVAANSISHALSSSPMLSELNLRFFFGSDCNLRRGRYEFIRVEYLKDALPAGKYPIAPLLSRPPQCQWEIVVQPVPYMYGAEINRYIVDVALPQIERWLSRRLGLDEKGSEILSFFFNEMEHSFSSETVARLEPQKTRNNVITRVNFG
jgi:hypothetical protein